MQLLTKEAAHAVFDILVAEAGASEHDRNPFVWHHAEDRLAADIPSEWRFQGDLGFGGKLYVERDR